ncbi:MAG: UPF0182 family membrane protein [Sporichthyaceae bacterium]
MSFDPPGPSGGPAPGRRPFRPAAPRRAPRALLPVAGILFGLVIAFLILTDLITDLWWFRSVQYSDVFTSRLTTRSVLFVVFAALMAGLVALNVIVAYRLRPAFRGMSAEQQNLDRYRVGLDPFKIPILLGVCTVVGIMAGTSAAAEWRTWLLWRNGTSFKVKDPQFGKDVSFYVFDYPWFRFVLGFGFAVVLVSLLAAVVTHYLYGGLRLQTPGEKATPGAQVHISVLLGLFVLLKAIAYWMDRYGLAIAGGGFDQVAGWTGLRYKDENALLPAKEILAVIALICAVLFFANIWRRTWMLPGIGFGLLVLSAVLIGTAYPAIVQQFQVRPSEAKKEAPYIGRNIDATRAAYGLTGAKVEQYPAKTTVQANQLRADAASTANVRLLDPNIVSPAFLQEQQILGFYSFSDSLRIDRYTIDGKNQDVVAAVRELDLDRVPPARRNWINDHFLFTHGYGLVAASGNTVEEDGSPNYLSKDIPPTGKLGEYEPRVYFGEKSPDYSIVGSKDGQPREFDRGDGNQQVLNTYQGKGGVGIGSFWRKAMYAVKFREQKILLSSEVNPASKVLYIRDPRARVQRVAPWLTLDSDPYPAVIDKKIQWVVDGYTTSGNYPYASRTTLGRATQTTLTDEDRRVIAPRDEVNYIRNSVKATVDAYDGTITLYTWDEADPVLQTWKKSFPGTVKEKKDIPAGLLSHLRYPEDFFKVQREMLTRYHVTNPSEFYTKADFWQVPLDPTGSDVAGVARVAETAPVPPYYLTLKMPGQSAPTFSLTTTFEPVGRTNLSAFMAVNAEPGPDYGTIRVLQIPSGTTVAGPRQVQTSINSDKAVSEQVLLYKGNQVKPGNLLTLPVGGGLLFVEPLYVQPQAGTQIPRLAQVIVSFGAEVAIGDDLKSALDKLFGGQSGAVAPPSGGGGGGGSPAKDPDAAQAIADAQKAFEDGQAALKAGNFAEYGKTVTRLKEALERAQSAQGKAPAKATPEPDAKATSPPAKT